MGNTHHQGLEEGHHHRKSQRSSGNSPLSTHQNPFHHRHSTKSNHSNYEQQLDTATTQLTNNNGTLDENNHHHYQPNHQLDGEILVGLPNITAFSGKDALVVENSLEKFKILLCGSGSSGKTTFLKSIELYKKGAFMESAYKKGIIYFNIIRDLGLMCKQYLSVATEFLNFISGLNEENYGKSLSDLNEMFPRELPREITDSMDRLIKVASSKNFLHSSASRSSSKQYNPTFDTYFNEQTFEDIESLWKYRPFNLFAHFHLTHSSIPEFLTPVLTKMDTIPNITFGENESTNYSKFMLSLRNSDFDDLIYFLDRRLNELYPPYQYDPNWVDLLHRRQKTVGFYHLNYVEDAISEEGMRETRNYIFIDTAGQRSERKKWSICYPNTFTLFYFVSLADINLTLYESNVENRLLDSLHLFEHVCQEPDLIQTPIVLFFTKTDILKRKIKNGLKPIELFEKIEKLYSQRYEAATIVDMPPSSATNDTEKNSELSLNISSGNQANQVDAEFNQFIEYISAKFKEKLLPTQTITIYTLDCTEPTQFKTTFKEIMQMLNKTIKD